MTELTGETFGLLRPPGGIGLLGVMIVVARALTRRSDDVFPAWQGMQYMRDMESGRGQLAPLDNDRYGTRSWTRARDILASASTEPLLT